MKYLSIAVTFLNFLSFLISVLNIFKKVSDINKLKQITLKLISILTWFSILYFMYLQPKNLTFDTLNVVTQFILFYMFWKTSSIVKKNQFSIVYSNDLPNKLVQEGLYKKIRHPFYMVYILSYFISALTSSSIFCLALSFTMTALYYDAAKTEEKKFASTALNKDYESYKKTAGLFWPKLS